MKRLFREVPQDLLEWLIPGAHFSAVVSAELDGEPIHADYLYEITLQGKSCLLHIEFQRSRDSKMAERLWEYNVRASLQYGYPVWSCVIYLKKENTRAEPFLIRELPNGKVIHRFVFDIIRLWEIPTQELMEKRLIGLVPLLVLTKDGARREVIEEAITILNPPGEEPKAELLALTYGFASLVFKSGEDQEWLKWRFSMLDDILSETEAFQEIARKGHEKGLKEGLKEGLREGLKEGIKEGELQARRQTLCDIVQERFPELTLLAASQTEATNDTDLLRRLTVKISITQSVKDAEQLLLAITREDKKN